MTNPRPPLEQRPLLPQADRPDWSGHLVLPRAFTARECDEIIEVGSALAFEEATLAGADEGAVDDGDAVRRSRVSWLPPGDGTDWIYRKLAALAERANRTYRFDLTGFAEDLQFTTYEGSGAFYTWHQDGLAGEVAGRKLSLVVQLSPPGAYEGGDLEFLDVATDYGPAERETWRRRARARGTVVAFPAFEHHRVTPLGRGVRRSLVCWIGGPPFR